MVPDRIEREMVIDAPLERVWSVIMEAEHVGRWFGDAGAYIDEERRTYRDGNVEGWAMETADLTDYLARQVA